MKARIICSLLFISALSFSSISFSANTEANTKKDGEVIAWIAAIDSFEIAAAEVASKKTVETPVKDYANTLYTQHTQNLKEVAAISNQIQEAPVETKGLTKFVEGGRKELSKLDPLNDKTFQKAYIDAMVAGHTQALQKVDNDLMKIVTNPELKKHVEATRAMIYHHLVEGKEIKAKLNIS